MKGPRRLFRGQSLRLRITAAFVLAGVLLAGSLTSATFFAAREFLLNQRVTTGTDETVLVLQLARDFFRQPEPEPDQFVAQLQLRGTFEAVVTVENDFFRSDVSLTPTQVPTSLRTLAQRERLGYILTPINGRRTLVFGAPLPPESTDVFLFFSLEELDQTLSVLLRVLIVAGFAIIAVAGVSAQRVAGRILRPVTQISTAAQRVAEGLLETRVETATADEVGVLAASFNEMASAFQTMLDRERRFVANVSHELRTPLATLRTTSEMLVAHRHEFPPASREAVELLAEDVANVQRLVEELMEVSEVDAGRAVIRWEPVDLRSLARAVVAKARRDTTVDGEQVVTLSDKGRLERIVSNLVENAYEHGRGTDVHVAVERRDDACAIEVSDAGPGITEHELPHLFDRFYKTDSSRSRERGGIGLGLAIAIENARLLGGTITASSEPGMRTRFRLEIPYREGSPEDER